MDLQEKEQYLNPNEVYFLEQKMLYLQELVWSRRNQIEGILKLV
jgi:hypothetical protein